MKLNRKWILVLSLVLSVAIATGGTLAYMTDTTDKVTNTFTLGNVTIELTEPAWGNNNDPHPLYPGTPVAKDPTITNKGRTNAWVWMEMTVPAEVYPYLEFQTIDTSAWIIDDDDVDTTGKVTLLYKSTLAPNGTAIPFTAVELAEDANLPNTLESFNIEIIAYAIQDKPFDDVEEAYAAFQSEQPTEVGTAAELKSALAAGGLVKLANDITLTADDEGLAVPSGITVELDLNGKTISQTKACTASYEMLNNDGTLTITGNGKLSFNDTGSGDVNVGWASYTVRNSGTLVVENGTIEHLGTQTYNGNNAVFHYDGNTTIKGGSISAPYSRSLRVWKGEATVTGGTFDGQVWVQAMEDCSLTITGGSFKPATHGNDGSSVFVTNDTHNPSLSVSGGSFATKIGCSVPSKLAGAITGGTFSYTAKANTNAALFAESFGN